MNFYPPPNPGSALDNAAVASQNIALIEDMVTRGAILRSMYQWIEAEGHADGMNYSRLLMLLRTTPGYDE